MSSPAAGDRSGAEFLIGQAGRHVARPFGAGERPPGRGAQVPVRLPAGWYTAEHGDLNQAGQNFYATQIANADLAPLATGG